MSQCPAFLADHVTSVEHREPHSLHDGAIVNRAGAGGIMVVRVLRCRHHSTALEALEPPSASRLTERPQGCQGQVSEPLPSSKFSRKLFPSEGPFTPQVFDKILFSTNVLPLHPPTENSMPAAL